ncbi:hypothetical protein [Pyxidicoccus xibeiensis]|uniref:hypothetical protein n=1 Tax=Pyxidicoccus xibeiensis TaxID=2906759 RepID=UPI0020A79BB9|nr:hypothetical protein [Pyxidicoccus xibeiensis]MCP3144676.1 hypothetical protein [Pyxidicoccus xibeiensis]
MTTLTTRPSAPPSAWVLPATRAALDAFFQGFGFTADEDLSALALWVLDSDSAHGAQPRDAVALARARMEAWLAEVLGQEAAGTLLTRGRAAFVLCDGARLGARLLTRGSVPEDFARTLRAAVPVPAPAQVASVMPEQQLVLWPFGELLRRGRRAVLPDVSISR